MSSYRKTKDFILKSCNDKVDIKDNVYYYDENNKYIYLNGEKYFCILEGKDLIFFDEHKIYLISIEINTLSIFTDINIDLNNYEFVSLFCINNDITVRIKSKINLFNNEIVEFKYIADKGDNNVNKIGELHKLKILNDVYTILAVKPNFTQQDIDENAYSNVSFYYQFPKQLRLYQKIDNYYKIIQITAFRVNYKNRIGMVYNKDKLPFLSLKMKETQISNKELKIKNVLNTEYNNFYINSNEEDEYIYNLDLLTH